jgi:hypothetical protein
MPAQKGGCEVLDSVAAKRLRDESLDKMERLLELRQEWHAEPNTDHQGRRSIRWQAVRKARRIPEVQEASPLPMHRANVCMEPVE